MKQVIATVLALCIGGAASAGTVTVAYSGSYDESSAPNGDYDAIGGLQDVGLFNLVAGVNTFTGSIYSPNDSSDGWLIGIGAGLKLVGAQILWGTNLPDNYATAFGTSAYLQQSSWDQTDKPEFTLEESSPTPRLFTLDNLVGGIWGEAPELYDAGALDIGPGQYLSLINDLGATCAQTLEPDGQFLVSRCVEGIDYRITYTVESISSPPPSVVPLPAGLPLLLGGMAGFGLIARRKRKG